MDDEVEQLLSSSREVDLGDRGLAVLHSLTGMDAEQRAVELATYRLALSMGSRDALVCLEAADRAALELHVLLHRAVHGD